MSIDALRRIRTLRLPPGDKLTLMIMTTYADRDDSNAFPSVKRLAEECGCTERAVQQRLARLRRDGFLEVQFPARQHRPRTYRVVVPKVATLNANTKKEARGESDFTSNVASEVNPNSPHETVRGANTTSRGETERSSEVNGRSPDQYKDQSIDHKDRTAAQPRFSTQAQEPHGNNYRVIQRLAIDLLQRKTFDSESDLVDATKWACAERGIDYGRHQDVDPHVVHRACASAWKVQLGLVKQIVGAVPPRGRNRRPGLTGPAPPGKYDHLTITDPADTPGDDNGR